MCRLQRGTQEELCRTFFELYDLNGDKKLDGEEIIEVYQHLLSSTSRTKMTDEQKAKVWLERAAYCACLFKLLLWPDLCGNRFDDTKTVLLIEHDRRAPTELVSKIQCNRDVMHELHAHCR